MKQTLNYTEKLARRTDAQKITEGFGGLRLKPNTQKYCQAFTIWTQPKPTAFNSVYRLALRMGITVKELIKRLETECNYFTTEQSILSRKDIFTLGETAEISIGIDFSKN